MSKIETPLTDFYCTEVLKGKAGSKGSIARIAELLNLRSSQHTQKNIEGMLFDQFHRQKKVERIEHTLLEMILGGKISLIVSFMKTVGFENNIEFGHQLVLSINNKNMLFEKATTDMELNMVQAFQATFANSQANTIKQLNLFQKVDFITDSYWRLFPRGTVNSAKESMLEKVYTPKDEKDDIEFICGQWINYLKSKIGSDPEFNYTFANFIEKEVYREEEFRRDDELKINLFDQPEHQHAKKIYKEVRNTIGTPKKGD